MLYLTSHSTHFIYGYLVSVCAHEGCMESIDVNNNNNNNDNNNNNNNNYDDGDDDNKDLLN